MKHAIVGIGAIGSLIACAIRESDAVEMLSLHTPPVDDFTLRVTYADGTERRRSVRVRSELPSDENLDVLWVATKWPHLRESLAAVSAAPGIVVPLMNGLDHIAVLEAKFDGAVAKAAIVVEAEAPARGVVVLHSAARLRIAGSSSDRVRAVAASLDPSLVDVAVEQDGDFILWSKACFFVPFALLNASTNRTAAELREDAADRARFAALAREVAALAAAENVTVDPDAAVELLDRVPPSMRSSLQRDVLAQRDTEIDAIGYAMLRRSAEHGVPCPVLHEVVAQLSAALPVAQSRSA